jgi:hypothetical protein
MLKFMTKPWDEPASFGVSILLHGAFVYRKDLRIEELSGPIRAPSNVTEDSSRIILTTEECPIGFRRSFHIPSHNDSQPAQN